MRRTDPLILGAGPAGCAAAIVLARAGKQPLLVDRDEGAGDALCGGFLGWRTADRLRELGLDSADLGAQRVERLVLFGPGRPLEQPLPGPAWGLSRQSLDTRLRELAIAAGAEFTVETIREVDGLTVLGRDREWHPQSLFLATGKHDVRGAARPRDSHDPTLGLRLRLRSSSGLAKRLAGKIELHLFDRGYGGIVLQEGGSANVCLALRKSLLAEHGGEPHRLLAALASRHPHFALRLEADWRDVRVDTIGSVPYGWSTPETIPGLFRLGDQAAVIPSLAGEGIDIALASGVAAASAWLVTGAAAAPGYQAGFHQQAKTAMEWAATAWRLVERPWLAGPALAAARFAPSVLTKLITATRID
jgi:flavin-dependent dehydrogenase